VHIPSKGYIFVNKSEFQEIFTEK